MCYNRPETHYHDIVEVPMTDHPPERPHGKHPDFIVRTHDPLNGGPPPDLLRESPVTPLDLFFVRNHGTIPEIDPASHRLAVGGMVGQPLSLSLDELRQQFPRVVVEATLQCAGNRRDELNAVERIRHEVPWGTEAISSAVWAGAPLREVLRAARVGPDAAHVAFTGLDEVARQGQVFGFGGSIPLEKALGPEVIVAYEMNGGPIPPAHGFPLRVIAPGYIGARSVKWLAEITVQAAPSDNYFQAHAYKLFPLHVSAETVDWSGGLMLGEMPVSSAICLPSSGATLAAGAVLVQGYAFAGGGRTVERVDVSADGGATWVEAELKGERPRWAWRFWQARIELPPGRHQLVARAWDSAANTQPDHPRHVWNFKGYMNNAWHRVDVIVEG
jgi:sulfite oxidase